ncbi:MAG: Uma2 family endonuclease [Planctomycetota bacterium]
MSTAPQQPLSAAQYLEIERSSVDQKHEFYAGEMFAMAGASKTHVRIATTLTGMLYASLKGTPCEPMAADMRVLVDRTGLYTYPDIVVVCGEPEFEDDQFDTLLNPKLVVEVLSDSTAAYDRGKKFDHYRQVASLEEYVLVSQDEPHIESFVRQPGDRWLLGEARGIDASMALESLGVTLPLTEVYARIDFSA